MASKSQLLFEFDNYAIPLSIIKEWRTSVRISIAKTGAFLRLPNYMPSPLVKVEIQKAKKWLSKTVLKDPASFDRFSSFGYPNQFEKVVYGKTFTIEILRKERKTNSGKIEGQILKLKLSDQLSAFQEKDVIKKLQSRLFAQYFHNQFSDRVEQINKSTYRKTYNSVNLKYNRSNWGSCSSQNNLNFSTRLLLTPEPVMDYVIVHELAHLSEMNHSSRFWNLVEQAMPSYKEKEKWLKKHGSQCDF